MKSFSKMWWGIKLVVIITLCLNFAFVNSALAYGTMLKPSSAVNHGGVVEDIGGQGGQATELAVTAKKLGLLPQALANFRAIERKVIDRVRSPLRKFVGTINKALSKKTPFVFGSNLPADAVNVDPSQLKAFAEALAQQYGLNIKDMKITRLLGDLDPKEVFKNPRTKDAFGALDISIAQALGPFGFAGGGEKAKKPADANAVRLGEDAIRKIVTANPNLAIVVLGDEGTRDKSAALNVGSIYYSGYGEDVLRVFGKPGEKVNLAAADAEIARLLEKGVKLLFFVGDALEVTNGVADPEAVSKPTDSWSMVCLIDKNNIRVNDEGSIGGISYHAEKDAGVTPFMLPSEALPKIAAANGVDITDQKALAKFMNQIKIVTLGPRKFAKGYEKPGEKHRHQAIIDDANKLKDTYTELQVVTPGDGDLMPRILSILGLKLDGYQTVTFGRSGPNEATAALVVAKNTPGGYFTSTYVSKENTNSDYSPAGAAKFTDAERKAYETLGISPEVYRNVRNKDAIDGNGTVAMTSVTGASPGTFGERFANLLQRVQFNELDDADKVVTNTFLVTPDGSVFVVTTQFQTEDLAKTQDSIMHASVEARKYLADEAAKVEAKQQFLKDLAEIIEVTPNAVKVLNRQLFLDKGVDILADAAAHSINPDVKVAAKRILLEVAPFFGLKLASDHEFYMAKQEDKWSNITVPAVNGRASVYLSLKPLYRVAKQKKVGVLKTEVARSEQRYSAQDSAEITAISIAAAIKEGYTGLLFVQQDHNQFDRKKFFKSDAERQKEIEARNALFHEGLLAGQYCIDLDPSTLADLEALAEIIKIESELVEQYLQKHPELLTDEIKNDKEGMAALRHRLVDEIEMGDNEDKDFLAQDDIADKVTRLREELYPQMHKTSIEVSLNDIRTIRRMEKEVGLTKSVAIGIEERHIDDKQLTQFPSTVLGSITISQAILKACKQEGLVPHCKISLQSGAMHGLGGVVDFGIYERHKRHRKEIGVSVFVQHGASTLPKNDFNQMRDGDVGEVHLATEYQKIVFAIVAQELPELAEKMAKWLEEKMAAEKKSGGKLGNFQELWNQAMVQEGKNRQQIIAEILGDSSNQSKKFKGNFKDLVKELSAPFKYELGHLPPDVAQKIDKALFDEYSLILGKLGVEDTQELIERFIPYNDYPVELAPRPAGMVAVFAKEEEPVFNSAVIVDASLIRAGGTTEISKLIARLQDQAVVFYGPGAGAMKILSGGSKNILTADNAAKAVEQLTKERGIAPANIRLITTAFNETISKTGVYQKIVSTDDPMSVMFGLVKVATEVSPAPEAMTAFVKLYEEVETAGAVVPLTADARAKMLAKTVEVAETMKVESTVETTEQQREIIDQVATDVGV